MIKTLYFLLSLSTLLYLSCGNKDVENSNILETAQPVVTNIIYSRQGDCVSFIKGIDFSSLCVTEKKNIAYETENSSNIRCQYEILKDNWKEETHFVVTWKDYVSYSKGKMEMDQLLSKGAFHKTGERLYNKTQQIENLGDMAYIGYEQLGGGSDKHLSILLNNVTININTNALAENCLSSDDELLKLGQLIVNRIKD